MKKSQTVDLLANSGFSLSRSRGGLRTERGHAEREERSAPGIRAITRERSLGHQTPHRRGQPGPALRSGSDHDRGDGPQGTMQTLDQCKSGLCRVRAVLADGSHVGESFTKLVRDMLNATAHPSSTVSPENWLMAFKNNDLAAKSAFCCGGTF